MNRIVRARVLARRKLIKEGYGSLYDDLHKILVKHNPAGLDVARGDERDDYGLPVGTLIPKLKDLDAAGFKDALYREMHHWYRDESDSPSRYEQIAGEMWAAWTQFRRDLR